MAGPGESLSRISAHDVEIDIGSLWAVLRGSAAACVAIAGLVGLLTFAALSLATPQFLSEAQLLIGGRSLGDRLRDPQVGSAARSEALSARLDKEAIASQVIALRSRDLALLLAADLHLAGRPEFNDALARDGVFNALLSLGGLTGPRAGEAEDDRVLRAYYEALRVSQGKDSRVITIAFASADSALAAKAANRLAELYQDWLRRQSLSQTADASAWLKPQIEKLSGEVRAAELHVEQFRSKANLFRGTSDGRGLNEQQLVNLAAEVTKASVARSEAEARARSARDLMRRGFLEAVPDVQRSPVIQSLIAQRVRAERERAEAGAVLLPAHPRMRQLDANVADLRRQIRREAMSVVAGVEKEAKVALLREALAKGSLRDMKATLGDKAGDMAGLAALESEAKAKRRELENLQASLEAARSRVDAKAVPLDAQIISRARPESVPAYPKRLQVTALTTAATLMLSLAFAVTRALLATGKPGIRTVPAPTVAMRHKQPEHAADDNEAGWPMGDLKIDRLNDGEVTVAAAARRLLGLCRTGCSSRTLVVGQSSGGTTRERAEDLVRRLALSRASAVLVEWDGGAKSETGAAAEAGPSGISDLLTGSASFDDIINALPGSTAHIIGWGRVAGSASLLDPDRLNLVLDALDEVYEQVVIAGADADLRALSGAHLRVHAIVVLSGTWGGALPSVLSGRDLSDVAVIRLGAAQSSALPSNCWPFVEPLAEAPA